MLIKTKATRGQIHTADTSSLIQTRIIRGHEPLNIRGSRDLGFVQMSLGAKSDHFFSFGCFELHEENCWHHRGGLLLHACIEPPTAVENSVVSNVITFVLAFNTMLLLPAESL
jgi:hypothetical protein